MKPTSDAKVNDIIDICFGYLNVRKVYIVEFSYEGQH